MKENWNDEGKNHVLFAIQKKQSYMKKFKKNVNENSK